MKKEMAVHKCICCEKFYKSYPWGKSRKGEQYYSDTCSGVTSMLKNNLKLPRDNPKWSFHVDVEMRIYGQHGMEGSSDEIQRICIKCAHEGAKKLVSDLEEHFLPLHVEVEQMNND